MSDLTDKINEVIGRFTIGEISRARAHFELELLDERLADRVDINFELLHYRVVLHPDDADEGEEEVYSWEEGEEERNATSHEAREQAHAAKIAKRLAQREAEAAAQLRRQEEQAATRLRSEQANAAASKKYWEEVAAARLERQRRGEDPDPPESWDLSDFYF